MVIAKLSQEDTNNPRGLELDATTRLRIATRIHFALLRHFGEDVEVSVLLRGGDDAREALWVCQASGDAELVTLAEQFRHATRQEVAARDAAARRAAPQDTAWSQNTSGFGLSRPPELDEPKGGPTATSGWFKPMSWLRAGTSRNNR